AVGSGVVGGGRPVAAGRAVRAAAGCRGRGHRGPADRLRRVGGGATPPPARPVAAAGADPRRLAGGRPPPRLRPLRRGVAGVVPPPPRGVIRRERGSGRPSPEPTRSAAERSASLSRPLAGV